MRRLPLTVGRAALVALTSAGLVTTAVATAPDAAATVRWPSAPRSVSVHAVGAHYVTVSARRSAHTARYRLYVSRVKSDLYYDNLTHRRRTRSAASSRHPSVTVHGLQYTIGAHYYRLATVNGPHQRVSPIRELHLRPATPTGLRAGSASGGVYLGWHSGAASRFQVVQSTSRSMSASRVSYTTPRSDRVFTPYGIHKGTRYYFRIRARNGSTHSAYSKQVSAVAARSQQYVRIMTYNLLSAILDGTHQHGQVVAPWSQRRAKAAALVRKGNPDVITIEEGKAWAPASPTRQVDSLAHALGGDYTVAGTEDPKKRVSTGCYVLYRRSAYAAVGNGGNFTVDSGRYAAYQVLRNRTSGATFLVVAAHLTPAHSAHLDRVREQQTATLVTKARRIAASRHLPVIYGGDFNSRYTSVYRYDGPGRAMRAAYVADSFFAAQSRRNASYNSENNLLRTPPQSHGVNQGPIDRIFAERGVAIRWWYQVLDLVHGRFVGTIPSDHNPVMISAAIPY